MSFNALPAEQQTAEMRVNTIVELLTWLKDSGYADKAESPQPYTPRLVERRQSAAGSLRHSPIKGL